jgi:FtsP/CotA-like multicopper oxidase with cupredoxin domain
MQTIMRNILKLIAALLLVVTILGFGPAPSNAYAGCIPTISFDLYAKTGTTTVYTGSPTINIWGFSSGPTGGTDPATLPGPVLDVNQGECVGVTLHNVDIPGSMSLLFEGQNMVPDTVGVGTGGSITYTFAASNPGTFLYEAGLTPNNQIQVAMGLYGALIVRPPIAGQAYSSASTAFDAEAVLVLSELDTLLSNSASPTSFDIRNFKPKYLLINGKAYPGTTTFPASAGDNVLFRYVNAGLSSHSMAVLGFSQRVVAEDGNPFAYARRVAAESIAPGATLDAIGTIPASATDGSKFAVYDSNLMLRNNTGVGSFDGFGGMITFVTVGIAPVIGLDTAGPATSNMGLPASSVNSSMSANLSASISDVSTGNSNVTAAEFFIDSTGANGSGTPMSGTFGSPGPLTVNATISGATIGSLSSGNHTVYAHGQDSAGNWGPFALNILKVDNDPPSTTNPSLSPNPASGSVNVSLTATGNDTATGNNNIVAAEYWIDSGAHIPMTVIASSPTAGLSATIPAATVAALSEGAHTVSISSMDTINSAWGPAVTITLTIDKTGPTASSVGAAPNPNNGTLPINSTDQAVRVTATFDDSSSGNGNVVAGEGFIDTIGTNGTGFTFIANDGVFNSPSESGYADIPLVVINSLSSGSHTIHVHGKDSAGNWGTLGTLTLDIDRTPPAIVSIDRVDPDPTSAASVHFLVTFSEDVTGVTASKFSLAQAGGLTGASITSVTGAGATRTVTVSTGTAIGSLGLDLTSATGIKDLAGNALPSTGLPYVGQVYTFLTPPLYFSTSSSTNPPGVTGTADDADIYFWDGAVFSRSVDMTAITNPLPGSANLDGFERVSATEFYVSFTGTVTISLPGPDLTVQDEDVVYYNAGTWALYFDGTPAARGLSGSDLDAISIVGGILYFSTDDTDVPAGVSGSGDDADIYSWNGSSFARVFDASALGWSGNNVDGLEYVDATHLYLSYSPDSTNIPVLGIVQDEDVVYYDAGTWSVYFEGTAKGLTGSSLDVDAFDLP